MISQTWLNCDYEFISAKNIIKLFVSSDNFTCLIRGRKTINMDYSLYISMKEEKKARRKKNLYKFTFSGKSKGG